MIYKALTVVIFFI